jgi:hypothetical protein
MMKLSTYVKKNLTDDQITFLMAGERKKKELSVMVEEALGVAKHMKVIAKNQSIIQGPPGIGKSFTTKMTCIANGLQPIEISSGATLSFIATKFAFAEYFTPANKEIVVLYDDADDVVFGDKKHANNWKNVFQDQDIEPVFSHPVNLGNELRKLEKDPTKKKMAEALKSFMPEDEVGVSIPLTRFRSIFLTNFDYEEMSQTKSKTWMAPIVDRFNYNRLNYDWTTAWGWLSNVLLTTQPFDKHNITLNEAQKVEIIRWVFDKWGAMGNKCTYRTIMEMAQYIINEPNNYLNRWEKFKRIK